MGFLDRLTEILKSQANYFCTYQRKFIFMPVFPSRQLEIAGQEYLLSIIPINSTAPALWRFQLENKTASSSIPGGFKLKILIEGENFHHNETVAMQAVDKLWVDVYSQPGTALTWEIEPIPEGYQREILIFS